MSIDSFSRLAISRDQFLYLASKDIDLPADLSVYVVISQVLECACTKKNIRQKLTLRSVLHVLLHVNINTYTSILMKIKLYFYEES